MESKRTFTLLPFGLFFIGLFMPNELFKSLSYLGIAVFFISRIKLSDIKWKLLLNTTTIFLSSFYLLHVVGLFYSSNLDEGIRITVLRLPLLLVPLFLFCSKSVSVAKRRIIEYTYLAICVFSGFIGLAYRLHYVYFVDYNFNWLYNDNLVSIFGLQAVYFGIYLCIASLFATKALLEKQQKKKWLFVLALLCISFFMLLLASRTSLILFVVLNFVLVLSMTWKKSKKPLFILGSCMLVLLAALITFFPATLNRFKAVSNIGFSFDKNMDYYHFGEELDGEQWNGLNSRLAIWSAAAQAVAENAVFGTGTGDKQIVLRKKYQELGFHLGLDRNFGTHNQYLEVLIMFGFFGLLLFLLAMIIPLVYFLKKGNILSALILLAFAVAFFTEDFLGRNQGVAVFAFFYAYHSSFRK